MKRSDRTIIAVIALGGLLAAFWFLVASPKRAEVSKLDDDIAALEDAVAAQEQLAATAEQAKTEYEANYHRLVVLGKAVPGDHDSASLVEQTAEVAATSGIDFRGIKLGSGGGSQAPVPVAQETTADPATPAGEVAGDAARSTPAPAPVAATEATAATLPIGATVGPAGLPVMPYDLSFRGDFFETADFVSGLDGMVNLRPRGIGVNGRLLTIDGFSLTGDKVEGFPLLDAKLHVTAYLAPPDQSSTAGATPAAPAPTTPAAPVPASTATGTVTP